MIADLNTSCEFETADPAALEAERVGVGERLTDLLCLLLAVGIIVWRLFKG